MSRHSEQRCAETSDDCKRMQEASQKVHGHQRISQRVERIRSTIQKAGSRQHEIVVRLKRRATSRRWKSSKSQATTPLARVGVTERVTSQLVTSQTRATPGFGRVVLSSTSQVSSRPHHPLTPDYAGPQHPPTTLWTISAHRLRTRTRTRFRYNHRPLWSPPHASVAPTRLPRLRERATSRSILGRLPNALL